MPSLLHLASAATLLLSPPGAVWAQLHSPQISLHRAEKPEDLSWLLTFATPPPGKEASKLVQDGRFKPFLQRSLSAPQSFWAENRPLADAAAEFLGGVPGAAIADNNRYLTVDGCVLRFPSDRGLLWVDLGLARPLVVFAAVDWISENKTLTQADATYAMWVFSNRPLALEHLPVALRHSIARWTAQPPQGTDTLQNITRVFVVDPDGTPHPISPAAIEAHNTLPAETNSEMKVQP